MSTGALTPASVQVPGKTPGVDGDLAKNLQVGQVLFGKVLRVYQDGSYLADLNGRQHIVDSAIPLRQDEVFRGKVVSLGERVVLDKMVDAGTTPPAGADAPAMVESFDKNLPNELKAFVNQHQSVFSTRTWNELIRAANRTAQPQMVLAAAVYLQKIGIPFSTGLSARLADYLSKDTQLKSVLLHEALHLGTTSATGQEAARSDDVAQILADYIKRKAEESLDHARNLLQQAKSPGQPSAQAVRPVDDKSRDTADYQFDQAVFQWLLNTQIGGAVSHRLVVLPLVLNGTLVELEMALFDQNENSGVKSDLKSKLIHLSLNMEHLGKIGVTINAVNQNLRVHFSSESENGLRGLAAHNQQLTKQLEQLNCRVDELTYAAGPASANQVTRPIVDLVVNTNSLSMLA